MDPQLSPSHRHHLLGNYEGPSPLNDHFTLSILFEKDVSLRQSVLSVHHARRSYCVIAHEGDDSEGTNPRGLRSGDVVAKTG